jgi:hypothetical protein
MATKNMRLTAYISPENWERLQKYAVEQDFYHDDGKINQSPLVNAILNSFFSSDTPNVTPIDNSNALSNTPLSSSNTLEDIKADLYKQLSEDLTQLIEVRLGE